MQAWLCESLSGAERLRFAELPDPTPGEGQAVVSIRAASLNFPDLLIVEGKYQFKPPLPFVPGSEFAGVVERVGPGVTIVEPGDCVVSVGGVGGFGTHAVVEANRLIRLPGSMSFEHAAAFVLTYGTTHHALVDRAALRSGETLLVLGAAGGVGTAAIQIGKALGARVVAGVSTEAKASFCREAGADVTFTYGSGDFRDALKAAGGGAPDVIYDPVGGPIAEPAFRSIAWRGRYLVIGFTAGIPALPLNLALLKGASAVGVFWGEYTRREPAAFARSIEELGAWYQEGRVSPLIDQVLPMSRLQDGYRRMASREAMGKIVMVNQ